MCKMPKVLLTRRVHSSFCCYEAHKCFYLPHVKHHYYDFRKLNWIFMSQPSALEENGWECEWASDGERERESDG